MTRRIVISTVLTAALVLSLTAWREVAPHDSGIHAGVSIPSAAALAVDAPRRAKAEILTGGKIEHRTVKSRLRLGLAVLVGLSVLLVLAMGGFHRLWPRRHLPPRRRSSVTLRAPPVLSLS